MNKFTFSRHSTNLFSDLSNLLVYKQESLVQLIGSPFSKESLLKQSSIKKNSFSIEKRKLLTSVLKDQYSKVKTNHLVNENIEKLNLTNTFTITTGHQLSLFTGPLFFIYKILNVIKLAKELSDSNPEENYIPVFWLASEDHDFEEVQAVKLFNKQLKWVSNQKGSVGRFEADDLKVLIKEFKELFSSEMESEVNNLIEHYQGDTYAHATFNLVHHLFKDFGLVIIDADHVELKKSFRTILKKEINEEFSFEAVNETNQILEDKKIKKQLTAREINLFYMNKSIRSRIRKIDNKYLIDEVGEFSKEELISKIEDHPECFSPNVVLRPLYQETILPNICYVGGGGEIAYWIQLKRVFKNTNTPFPILNVRNSLQIIDSNSLKKMNKIGINLEDIFNDVDELKKNHVLKNATTDIDFTSIDKYRDLLSSDLKEKVINVNKGLEKYAESEIAKLSKQLSNIQQKLIKAEKEKHDNSLKQIEQIKDKLFPQGKPQERVNNFFSLCSDGKVYSHLEELYTVIDPFEKDLIVLTQ
jgi:bacillithiol synthase